MLLSGPAGTVFRRWVSDLIQTIFREHLPFRVTM